MIEINEEKDVLLVDFSYFYIYRYFALLSWFKISGTEYDENLFISKYKTLFITNLTKLCKKFKIDPTNTILAGDCFRKSIWRCDLYKPYKENRDAICQKGHIINPNVIRMIYDELIPLLCSKGYQYVCIDQLEADDIIYCITRSISNKIIILTNDNDYLQMINENIDIVNLPSFKSIKNRGLGCPRKDLQFKVLCGDPSDNIPGIMGKKQALKFINQDDVNELNKFLQSNNLEDQYERNKQLIDMRCIPSDLVSKVIIRKYIDS